MSPFQKSAADQLDNASTNASNLACMFAAVAFMFRAKAREVEHGLAEPGPHARNFAEAVEFAMREAAAGSGGLLDTAYDVVSQINTGHLTGTPMPSVAAEGLREMDRILTYAELRDAFSRKHPAAGGRPADPVDPPHETDDNPDSTPVA